MKRQPIVVCDYTDWTVDDFENDLRTNPRYLEFYKKYNPNSVEGFIKSYASRKSHVYDMKKYYYREAELRESQFLVEADKILDMILQKKLFNLQCLWRANKIELPFIEYIGDFQYFRKTIRDCPFIEPITEAELELAINFILSDEDIDEPYWDDWQDYEGFKVWMHEDDEDDEEDENVLHSLPKHYGPASPIPNLYLYYDEHMGTSDLLNLPDLRGEKEEEYRSAWWDEENRLNPPKEVVKSPHSHLPYLNAWSDDLEAFLQECEDIETKELFTLKDKMISLSEGDELHRDLIFLLELREDGEEIAFEPHNDWYESVTLTANKWRRKKIAEMLPYAYETYRLEFDDEDEQKIMVQRMARFKFDEESDRNELRRISTRHVIKGREVLENKG